MPAPVAVVNAATPVRVCDLGGWTDTWFARSGRVVNLTASPGPRVQITAFARGTRRDSVVVHPVDLGDPYSPGRESQHPLLEAALAERPPPESLDLDIAIHSPIPPGAGTGTSAAVVCALLAALERLHGADLSADQIARAAHRVETERLGLQSGVQDQYAATVGGALDLTISDYPNVDVASIDLANELWWELETRVLTVFLGRSHRSSEIHERVIKSLEAGTATEARLQPLRDAAAAGRDALDAGDLEAFGVAMSENTVAQAALDPALVSPAAQAVIGCAQTAGASGWKVNGAGGDGGTVSVLAGPRVEDVVRLRKALNGLGNGSTVLDLRPDNRGLRVWDVRPEGGVSRRR